MTREEIVAEAEAALGAETWPAHPADDPVVPHETFELYLGAAGIIWALRRLGSSLDLDALAEDALRGYRESPNADEPASLLAGETGLLVLTRSDDDRLAELVAANERNPAWEVLWGSPGTILAAKAAGLDWRRPAEILAAEVDADGLWTQRLIGGDPKRLLGAVHGFAGNVHALRGYLSDDELRVLVDRVLRTNAVWDDGAVNWPPEVGREPDARPVVPRRAGNDHDARRPDGGGPAARGVRRRPGAPGRSTKARGSATAQPATDSRSYARTS